MILTANDHTSILRGREQREAQAEHPNNPNREKWQSAQGRKYVLRAPALADGARLWNLARSNSPLEVNSPYSYVLLASHFTGTCVVAERNAEAVAFASAFVSPAHADTIFVWQIAVNGTERGQGLGRQLLHHLLARPACDHVRFLEATVAPSNIASRSLFRSLARDLGVPMAVRDGLAPELFPDGAHEQEELFRVGPLWSAASEDEVAKGRREPTGRSA